MGARGVSVKSLYSLLKDLNLARTEVSSLLERASKTALIDSYQISRVGIETRVVKVS